MKIFLPLKMTDTVFWIFAIGFSAEQVYSPLSVASTLDIIRTPDSRRYRPAERRLRFPEREIFNI